MATLSQINANRANAQFSTGPTSPEGKANTRFNAAKHFMDAASMVIPGEDPAELEELADGLRTEWNPQGAFESILVQTIVRSEWLRRRYLRIEAQIMSSLIAGQQDSAGGVFLQDAAKPNVMGRLFQRQRAAQRDFDKAVDLLLKIRKTRQQMEEMMLSMDFVGVAPVPEPAPAPAPVAPSAPASHWVRSEPAS